MKREAEEPNVGVMTKAVLAAGLVNQAQLEEMKRWSPTLDPEAETSEPKTLEEAAALVSHALQSEGYVLARQTDLEAMNQFMATMTKGTLHLEVDDDSTEFEITFGKTPLGDFIIAWRTESIKDAMVNGQTYLIDGATRVFFQDVPELFFGEHKDFMVCVPSLVEHVS